MFDKTATHVLMQGGTKTTIPTLVTPRSKDIVPHTPMVIFGNSPSESLKSGAYKHQ